MKKKLSRILKVDHWLPDWPFLHHDFSIKKEIDAAIPLQNTESEDLMKPIKTENSADENAVQNFKMSSEKTAKKGEEAEPVANRTLEENIFSEPGQESIVVPQPEKNKNPEMKPEPVLCTRSEEKSELNVTTNSKLNNREWLKLLEDIIRLGNECASIAKNLPEDSRKAWEHIEARIEEIIERNGAEAIDGDTVFDVRRHQAEPAALVADGTEIRETFVPGWRVEGRILRRAKVKIKTEKE